MLGMSVGPLPVQETRPLGVWYRSRGMPTRVRALEEAWACPCPGILAAAVTGRPSTQGQTPGGASGRAQGLPVWPAPAYLWGDGSAVQRRCIFYLYVILHGDLGEDKGQASVPSSSSSFPFKSHACPLRL